MAEFTIPGDLDCAQVSALHDDIFAAVEAWHERTGIEKRARVMIAALLIDACGIMQDAPDEMRAAIAEEAVHFIMTNSGADARDVFDAHRKRHEEAHALAWAPPQGRA